MNKVSLNREKLSELFEGESLLGDVFKFYERKILEDGEIVCRFSVNGLQLSEEDEKKFAQFKIQEVEILEIESQRPDILLSEVISNWTDSLPRLIKKSDQLAQAFRFSGAEHQMSQFVDIVDSCQFLVESLMSLRSLCGTYDFVGSPAWNSSEELTARAIAEALTAFEKKDFVLLADVLEYDLGHCLQTWLETLTELRDNVHRNAVKGKQAIDSLDRPGVSTSTSAKVSG